MSDGVYTIEEFPQIIRPLIGLPVSLPWKGYGSSVFLELGELSPLASGRCRHNRGQACIAIHWDWRVESDVAVLYGSSNSGPTIAAGIAGLRNTTIQSLTLATPPGELEIHFSNGQCLRTMAMLAGDPQWSIRLKDGNWVCARKGQIRVGEGGSETTAEEMAVFDLAGRTAERWGIPMAPRKLGSCANCVSFVPLDGNGHLLDYGACLAAEGPLDGHIVNRESGCELFLPS